jgi:hypothetical protein
LSYQLNLISLSDVDIVCRQLELAQKTAKYGLVYL